MREEGTSGEKGDFCLQQTRKRDYNQEIKEDNG
jgi:hypothetical protein